MSDKSVMFDPRFIFYSVFQFTCPKDFDFYTQLHNLQVKKSQSPAFWYVNPNLLQKNFSHCNNLLEAEKQYEVHSYHVPVTVTYQEGITFIKNQGGICINPQTGYLIWQLNNKNNIEYQKGYKKIFPVGSKVVFLSNKSLWFDGESQWFMYIQTHPGNFFWIDLQNIRKPISNEIIMFIKKV